MTIITKSGDKKKLIPLPIPKAVGALNNDAVPSAPSDDPEMAAIANHQRRNRMTNCLVIMMAVLVLLMGIMSGVCIYRQHLRERSQRLSFYIPYDDSDVDQTQTSWVNSPSGWRDGPMDDYKFNENYNNDLMNENDRILRFLNQFFQHIQKLRPDSFDEENAVQEIKSLNDDMIHAKFFKEDVEINDEDDDDDDVFSDISVPDFKDGRSGRFIHDFINNLTTIVDITAKRCFVYPLDRENIVPPKSLFELMTKMQQASFFPDTSVLRQKMRVVIPELDDDDEMISPRTAQVCKGFKIYKLESFVSGVFKRSVDATQLTNEGKFAEFAGKGIINVDLQNIAEVVQYEKM